MARVAVETKLVLKNFLQFKNMNKPKILLLSGYARTGKDTFFDLLQQVAIEDNNNIFSGFSFAYELKKDLAPLVEEMGINIFNPTDEQKKIIRNLMIAYGCAWREIDINHWVKKVDAKIDTLTEGSIAVIRDTRFISEVQYYFDKYGRENVLLVEIIRNGAPQPPEEELKNQPELSKNADVVLQWETDPSLESLKPKVRYFYEQFILGREQ